MFGLFKKNTREEEVDKITKSIFYELTKKTDFEPTELEMVQVINNVRRKLHDHLKEKEADNMELSVSHQQKAKEIANAITFIE